MFEERDYIIQFTDAISEGLIFIDNKGKIQLYNKKAKEIFGVIYNHGKGHGAGRIEKGDIVIIADNSLGRDDGGMKPEDLESIGIYDEGIKLGDSIVAVGVYKKKDIRPVYRYKKRNEEEILSLDTVFLEKNIRISIDSIKKIMRIAVDNEEFKMEYINALGHMVLLDGNTKKVKFYQAKGYTIRRESIYDILSGKEYMAKGKNSDTIDVIGKEIFEVHGFVPAIEEFYEAAKGMDLYYKDKFVEINGRPTLCTLIPINRNNKRVGALLKVKDISELRKLAKERDEALLKLEEMEIRLNNQEEALNLFPNIVGESNKIKNIKNLLYKASKSNSTVLLLGESGTGKGLMAREIHNAGKNKDKPFIHVNCASIPENLIESELFGYEGGAFTGARAKGKMGFFEMADGGTIFLDEIAEIPVSMQVKLLQVLQNKTFFRVGGTGEISVDVRIIAATNKNLEEEVLKGRFREDLFYRINVFPIWIPPLRERKQDIYPLVYHILPEICRRVGCKDKHISGEGLRKLIEYDWPGNVRELENILERAVNLCEGDTILSSHLQIDSKIEANQERENSVKPLREIVDEAEKKAIINALKIFKGNKKKTMEALGIGKTSFYEKLKKYDIHSS